MTMEFIGDCVGWPARHVRELCNMQDRERDITRATFSKRVGSQNVRELSDNLGYARNKRKGLTMTADYHVGYCRSKLYGVPVYFVRHSGIEYVFGPNGFDLNNAEARYEQ